ncbi:phosphoribosyltransferase [Candidatus Uhrbacteria bacterium]|nr:phosphoribosyltransferase [Candidatus Uhrbacteria bacterium]
MLFRDRQDAAVKLAEKLAKYRGKPDVTVVALPRGGVVLGRIVADALEAPLDLVVPRKIGAPENEEYAIGAITETGEAVWNSAERARVSDAYAAAAMKKERTEAERRLRLYRKNRPARNLRARTVIIVDDGIATGFTMRAAIKSIKKERPKKIVVAAPVSPSDAPEELRAEADEVIVLATPALFGSIGAFYEHFSQVDDDVVVRLMN